MDLKQIAGEYAATFVKDGMKIGLAPDQLHTGRYKIRSACKRGIINSSCPDIKGNGSIGTAAKYSVDFVKRRTKSSILQLMG